MPIVVTRQRLRISARTKRLSLKTTAIEVYDLPNKAIPVLNSYPSTVEMGKAIVHGYYRYTDISFEWHQALPSPSDRSALKAFIAPESLTHPDNPLNLHEKSKGPGITLTMGTMENGESRLLCYWLHTVGFTEKLLPLPSSQHLLDASSLKTASPVTYKSGAALKTAIKAIQKNNKRLKGTEKTLMAFRDTFENVRTCWAEKKGTWLAIDFEGWEMDHTIITEYGWSVVVWQGTSEPVVDDGHYIVEEHRKYTNTTYVVSNRDRFMFGESQTIRLQALKEFIQQQITGYSNKGPLYLVFHDYHQDVDYLKALDAPIDELYHVLPDVSPDKGIFVADTSSLFGALEGLVYDPRPLDRLCALLRIPDTNFFHNAGNDAHFTMLALKSVAEGLPLDLQRNARWPALTETSEVKSVRVDWLPHQIDSDYDDMEGIFGPARPVAAADAE